MGVEDKIAPALQGFLKAHGSVEHLRVMADGHAGLTFGFDLRGKDGARTPYILKKSPDGVPRSGSADIFRQAPLLRALSRGAFPAPDVPWACEDEAVLGAPFVIMTCLPGKTLIVWDPAPETLAQFKDPTIAWTETARLMGALHTFDWRAELADWEQPTDLVQELDRWSRLLRHTQDRECLARAQDLAELLKRSAPARAEIGLVHGDLQPGNVLYDGGVARGLIDWDLAAIAPMALDVGWLMMIADGPSWAPDWRPVSPPDRAALLQAYRDADGPITDDLDWFQAFSNFRMAAITGLNLKLHRDGRRHDPIWEHFALSVLPMLTRALAILS